MAFQRLHHEEIRVLTAVEVEAAIKRNDPDELLYVPLSAALYSSDLKWAQSVCVRLSSHCHFNVRGNAILGLAHLSRRFGELDENIVKPILSSALRDSHEYVRGQANAAVDDTTYFLNWQFSTDL